ncbi:adenylyl-sulfate kinase [Pseudoalteromonas gelatinilytica]
MIIWITGLPGSGKTTLSIALKEALESNKISPIILDGDSLRQVFDNFSYEESDRITLAKTYAKLAKLLSDQGHIVIVATVSLFHDVHNWNKQNNENYIEVFIKPCFDTLLERDQKGLYTQSKKKHGGLVGKDIAAQFPIAPNFSINNRTKDDLNLNTQVIFNEIIQRIQNA